MGGIIIGYQKAGLLRIHPLMRWLSAAACALLLLSSSVDAMAQTSGSAGFVLSAGKTYRGSLVLFQRPADIEGTVDGRLVAIDSSVKLGPTAVVKGRAFIFGDQPVQIAHGAKIIGPVLRYPLTSQSAPQPLVSQPGPVIPARMIRPQVLQHPIKALGRTEANRQRWVKGQIALTLLTILAAMIGLVAAPKALTRVTDTIQREPTRALVAGVVALIIVGLLAIINWVLCLTIAWIPFAVVVLVLIIVTFIFSLLAGLGFIGGMAQMRLRQRTGSLFWRIVLALAVFLILNSMPVIGILFMVGELLLILMGLGALLITGLGREENWLGAWLAGRK